MKPLLPKLRGLCRCVAPRAGAWIETHLKPPKIIDFQQSPPARGRGLKLPRLLNTHIVNSVAPRAGAWIETASVPPSTQTQIVAPRAGAWIETM